MNYRFKEQKNLYRKWKYSIEIIILEKEGIRIMLICK